MPGTVGRLAHPNARFENSDALLSRGVKDGKLAHRCNLLYRCDAMEAFDLGKRWGLAGRECTVVCDELDLLPSILQNKHSAYWCLHYGRVPKIHILGSARQPQHIDKGWLSQADELVFFRVTGMQALLQIRKSGFPDADRLAAKVSSLKNFSYIHISGC